MAVRAIAEGAAAEGSVAKGAAAESSVAKGAAAKGAAAEGTPTSTAVPQNAANEGATADGAVAKGAAAESATAPMQTPAEQAPVTEQLTASTQPVPDSMQLIVACAAVHTAWEQNWGTVSEHEEGIHNQTSSSSGPRDSWGAKLHCNSPGVYSWQFNSRVADQLQASKVTVWEAAMTDCQHALLQLEGAKGIRHSSSVTPEQAISQYHPSAALEFRKQTQGIAEKARFEIDRRSRTARQNPTTHSWLDRARQTAEITQGLEQAAVESVEALKTVLQGQSWEKFMAMDERPHL